MPSLHIQRREQAGRAVPDVVVGALASSLDFEVILGSVSEHARSALGNWTLKSATRRTSLGGPFPTPASAGESGDELWRSLGGAVVAALPILVRDATNACSEDCDLLERTR